MLSLAARRLSFRHFTSLLSHHSHAVNITSHSTSTFDYSHLPMSSSSIWGRPYSFFTGSLPPSSKFQQRRLVGWSPDQFFKVVTDVDAYHHFVPWCQKSRVVRRVGEGSMEAELVVGFQMITEKYTSRVTMERPRLVRSRVSNSLLFHHLDSNWKLEPGPNKDSCWLTFDIDFAFNSHLYSSLADLFLSEVAKQMVNAFEGRAEKLYGRSSLVRIKDGKI